METEEATVKLVSRIGAGWHLFRGWWNPEVRPVQADNNRDQTQRPMEMVGAGRRQLTAYAQDAPG